MTRKLITAREGVSKAGRAGAAPREPHREAAGGRRAGRAPRADHHQGHREGPAHPHAAKDTQGRLLCAAAVGVGPDREERVDALLKAGCDVIVVDTAHGHSPRRARGGARHPAQLPGLRARRRQRGHRRGHAGADQGRRRRGQGRHRPGLHLHHPRGRRRGRAAAHRDRRLRPRGGPARRPRHRRRRHQVLGRRRQGDRRRREHGDDRLALRRHRRGARRGHPVPGPQLQELPRHGLDRRDEARAARTATSRPTSRRSRSWSPRASRAASRTRARWR